MAAEMVSGRLLLGWSCVLVTGQAVPRSGEATGEWYMGKERWCCMATAPPGVLSREGFTKMVRHKDQCEPKLTILTQSGGAKVL